MAIVYMTMSVSQSVSRVEQNQMIKRNLVFVQDRVSIQIKNPAHFAKILESVSSDAACNQSLRCVALKEDCGSSVYSASVDRNHFNQEITCLYDLDGVKFFDRSIASNGFTNSGESCNTFPSLECPYRAKVTWRPICSSFAACLMPVLEYKVEMEIYDQELMINPNRRVVRDLIK